MYASAYVHLAVDLYFVLETPIMIFIPHDTINEDTRIQIKIHLWLIVSFRLMIAVLCCWLHSFRHSFSQQLFSNAPRHILILCEKEFPTLWYQCSWNSVKCDSLDRKQARAFAMYRWCSIVVEQNNFVLSIRLFLLDSFTRNNSM